ncbi:MAG TPA: chloride channel protein [Candidatus Alistipes avicola]|uniref:Chloride channel protein n=1 Tax=Candidatus Alistipes avicola TaxID=2838432 RepID=A0A9D2RIX3_9BACT|nr:chloride channel protein [uncultured Alistipes sp.]HJA99380.1 chloride channel protein [Candidatus Alistipes avicola]
MTQRGERIYIWFLNQTKRLSNQQIMALLAIIVGVLAGLGTYIFEQLLYGIKWCLTNWFAVEESQFLFLLYPAVGIVLASLFVRYIVKDNISEGVTRVLYAMSRKNSHIASHNCWTSVVGGATTIGFGGSVGPEAPIVLTGAAIGSNVGRLARLNYKNMTLLLCCGAGAALSAIFKAPITGVVFVIEILMLDLTSRTVIPLLISSISAVAIALMLRGFDPIIAISLTPADAFQLRQIPLFILLGMLCGLMSYYFTTVNARVGAIFKKIESPYKKWLLGGAILGILIYIFPPLYGEGYEGFMTLMHGQPSELFDNSLFYRFSHIDWVVILFIIATMFFKVIAMASTNAAGGVGGTFAPSLFVGAFMGAITALVCNALFGWHMSIVSFTLVGMAGVMSGVMKAPLTSIFLIAELSNGYGLFIPLMITSCIAFAIDYYLDPDSIYTKQLRKKGELLTHDKDASVFVMLKLEDLVQDDGVYINENQTLGDIVRIISRERHDDYFPVLDEQSHLLGIVRLNDVREDLFDPSKYQNSVRHYMLQSPDKILQHEQIQSVLRRFEENHVWVLPVVDKENRYLGYISKNRILNAYREQLVNISQ